jgi:hypothetical protein
MAFLWIDSKSKRNHLVNYTKYKTIKDALCGILNFVIIWKNENRLSIFTKNRSVYLLKYAKNTKNGRKKLTFEI